MAFLIVLVLFFQVLLHFFNTILWAEQSPPSGGQLCNLQNIIQLGLLNNDVPQQEEKGEGHGTHT